MIGYLVTVYCFLSYEEGQTLQASGIVKHSLCQSQIRSPDRRTSHSLQNCSMASKGVVLFAAMPSAMSSTIFWIEGDASSCLTIFSPRFEYM